MENWKRFWSLRKSENVNSLDELLILNGYELTGLTSSNLKDALTRICFNIGVRGNQTFYEVGCGSGAILYTLHKMGYYAAGCDYSESLIEIANKLDITKVECLEANSIDVNKKFDYSFSFNVFQCFPNLEYTVNVLDLMLEKSKEGIFILDIYDEDKKDEFMQHNSSNECSYLFIPKSFWYEYAKNKNLELTIEDQHIKDYKNSKFHYNVYLKK